MQADVDLPFDAADIDRRQLARGVVDLFDAAGNAETHSDHSLIWGLVRASIDETRGADRRLSQREAAVVGGHVRVRQHGELFRFKAARDLFEQNAILEAAARKGDRVKARAVGGVAARQASWSSATIALARPLWKRAAISGAGVLRMRSPSKARHIASGSI